MYLMYVSQVIAYTRQSVISPPSAPAFSVRYGCSSHCQGGPRDLHHCAVVDLEHVFTTGDDRRTNESLYH